MSIKMHSVKYIPPCLTDRENERSLGFKKIIKREHGIESDKHEYIPWNCESEVLMDYITAVT